jgi:hypothetical protein
MNVDPLQMMIWRSYNYPEGTRPPYEGSFRRRVSTFSEQWPLIAVLFSFAEQLSLSYLISADC